MTKSNIEKKLDKISEKLYDSNIIDRIFSRMDSKLSTIAYLSQKIQQAPHTCRDVLYLRDRDLYYFQLLCRYIGMNRGTLLSLMIQELIDSLFPKSDDPIFLLDDKIDFKKLKLIRNIAYKGNRGAVLNHFQKLKSKYIKHNLNNEYSYIDKDEPNNP